MAGRRGKRLIDLSDEEEAATPAAAPARGGRGAAQRRTQEDDDELHVEGEGDGGGDEVELFEDDGEEGSRRGAAKKKGNKRSSQSQSGNDAFELPRAKKKSAVEELNQDETEKLVGDVVRYVLFRDATKQPIRRAEIGDKVLGEQHKDRKRQLLPSLIKLAQDKLRIVFGAELTEQKKKSKTGVVSGSGVYFLRSQVDASEFVAKFAENKQRTEEYGFLMTVITLVQMSENHVLSEDKLARLFRDMQTPAPLADLLAKFVKEGYLVKRKRKDASGVHDFSVGPRAQCELKASAVPEFLGKVFGEAVDVNRAKELEFDEEEAIEDDDDGPAASQAPAASQQPASQRGGSSQRPRR